MKKWYLTTAVLAILLLVLTVLVCTQPTHTELETVQSRLDAVSDDLRETEVKLSRLPAGGTKSRLWWVMFGVCRG